MSYVWSRQELMIRIRLKTLIVVVKIPSVLINVTIIHMIPFSESKGPYPLGDLGKIGAIIGGRQPLIAPENPWVWPKIARRSLADHRRWATGDRRPISRMFDISLPTDRPAMTVARRSVDVFVSIV